MKLSTGIAMGAALLAGTSAFAGKLPQVDRSDLMGCKTEIVKLHEKQIDFLAGLEQNCGSSPDADCSSWGDLKRKSIAADDFDWYLEGNDSCNGWDYPCYGPNSMNDLTQTDEYRLGTAKGYTSQPPLGPPPANDWDEGRGAVGLNYWSWAADICTSRVFLAKAEAAKANGSNNDSEAEVPTLPNESAGASSTAADGGMHAAACAEALAQQDAEYEAMNQRAPKPGEDKSAGGARALFQMGMYITDSRLKVLDEFCKGEPQYAMYPGVKASYDSALTGCRQVSSDGGDTCKPLKLW